MKCRKKNHLVFSVKEMAGKQGQECKGQVVEEGWALSYKGHAELSAVIHPVEPDSLGL